MIKYKYNSLAEFKFDYPTEYNYLTRNKLLGKFCKDMGWKFFKKGYWTKERCMKEALKYENKKQWRENSKNSYSTSIKNGWLEECTAHMILLRKPIGYWTKERCIEEALKYEYVNDWDKNSGSSYSSARKNGWLEECTAHMILLIKPNGYWTKERCIEEALKYEFKIDWANNSSGSYSSAKKNGWLEECTAHMIPFRKPIGYWTKECCMKEALTHENKKQWRENSISSYNIAKKNGWFGECTAHMKKTKDNGEI